MKLSSPFRYPGGKTKLYNTISQIIEYNSLSEYTYIEPFAGGAGLALKLLSEKKCKKVILNDFDYTLYCAWKCILDFPEEFIHSIENTDITIDSWNEQRYIFQNYHSYSILEVGFATFFLNRTNWSGVLSAGPLGGVNQSGQYKIDCRFNKKNLISRIQNISKFRNKIELYNEDVFDFLPVMKKRKKIFINFDPPYYVKGSQLYINYFTDKEHRQLKSMIDKFNRPWIITYDNESFIKELYKDYVQEDILINYSAGQKKSGSEIIIFSNKTNNPFIKI